MVYKNTYMNKLFIHRSWNFPAIEHIKNTRYLTLNITKGCNLGCPYCVSAKKPNTQHLPTVIEHMGGVEPYLAKIDQLIKGVHPLRIRLVGEGEVTVSPHFEPIVDWALSHDYEVQVQSNLHGIAKLERVLAKYPDKRKNFLIGLSYHAGAYLLLYNEVGARQWRDQWMYNWFPRLIALNVRIDKIDIPLHPILFTDAEFESELDYLVSLRTKMTGDFVIQPVSLVGPGYPEAYTLLEREWVAQLQQKFVATGAQYNTIWTPEEIPYMTHQMEVKGQLCWKRMRGVDIKADGTILLCHSHPPWVAGNVITIEAIDLYEKGPIPCSRDVCRCRAHAIYNSLTPQNVSMREYYYAYYMDRDRPEIAQLFKENLA